MYRCGMWRRPFSLRRVYSHGFECAMQPHHILNYRERMWIQFQKPHLWNTPFLKYGKILKLTTAVVCLRCEMPLCSTLLVISGVGLSLTPPHTHINEYRNILCVLAHMPSCHTKNTGSHLYNSSISPINSFTTGARHQMGKNVLSPACLSLRMVADIVPGLNTVSFLWRMVDYSLFQR